MLTFDELPRQSLKRRSAAIPPDNLALEANSRYKEHPTSGTQCCGMSDPKRVGGAKTGMLVATRW